MKEVDVFDNENNIVIVGDEDYLPIISEEDEKLIKELYKHPQIRQTTAKSTVNKAPWIQTYTCKRFTPTDPVVEDIDIEDIAHALSNICRFTGHSKEFYSVAQHCVLVSYICNQENALYGLLHDASEAYCQDIASPIKRSEAFDAYRKVESTLQKAVYTRFNLKLEEPLDVKKADILLLATEARDLMSPLHLDWEQPIDPLPFKIIPLPPAEAKKLFLTRFNQLFITK